MLVDTVSLCACGHTASPHDSRLGCTIEGCDCLWFAVAPDPRESKG